jgi:hypothetical protein
MPFPAGWPPRPSSGRASLRFFREGTCTAAFDANAYLFVDGTDASPFTPLPVVAPGSSEDVHIGGPPAGGGFPTPEDVAPDTHKGLPNGQAVPKNMIWAQMISIYNGGAGVLEFSFDGTNIHGRVLANERRLFRMRYEAGIAVRGDGGATPIFEIEAW